MIRSFSFKILFSFFCILTFFSCTKYRQVQFTVGYEIRDKLLAKDRAAQEGTLDFSNPKKLEYKFDDTFTVTPNSSLVLEYDFSILPPQSVTENFYLVLRIGAYSWELPMNDYGFNYTVPVEDSFNGSFSITLEGNGKVEKDIASVFKIRSLMFTERWFGFNMNTDEYNYLTPFVYMQDDNSYVIDVPPSFMPDKQPFEIYAVFSAGSGLLDFSGRKIEALPGTEIIYVPSGMYSNLYSSLNFSGQAAISGEKIGVFHLNALPAAVFPKPVRADPALVIAWPKENWRNKDYEVFRWERFHQLLVFDFADYALQDRMLKRLAFFVEKAGFRGRLAHDDEIADLHGWNAHDYRAADLASFFDLARNSGFPLSDIERELERILLNEGIIREEAGGIVEGSGAIISITRESPDYLRYRFMAHEGFHGLFFIDEDFRDFSRRRWEQLSAPSKRFITSFFEYQQYDTKDEYLLVNEFMAHVLQQSVSQAAGYFGKTLPLILESTWRASTLPKKDEVSGTWPDLADAFTAEAEAFSAYVRQRWGLAAGRVWSLRVN